MNYKVESTDVYGEDIADTLSYISRQLKNNAAALRLSEDIRKKYDIVSDNPYLYSLVKDKYLSAFGIRMVLVRNYLIFYIVDEKNKTVNLLRFLYSGRKWADILRTDISAEMM